MYSRLLYSERLGSLGGGCLADECDGGGAVEGGEDPLPPQQLLVHVARHLRMLLWRVRAVNVVVQR